MLTFVAYSLKLVKLLGPCKRMQHCWPTTPNNVGSCWHLLRPFAWALKYRSWSCQDSQKLQNNTSSHYPATIFALCIYFLQYETPLFRIYAFGTGRLVHTLCLQNLNFKLGASRGEAWPFIGESFTFFASLTYVPLFLLELQNCLF